MKQYRLTPTKTEPDAKRVLLKDCNYGDIVEWGGRPCLVVWCTNNDANDRGLVSLANPEDVWLAPFGSHAVRPLGHLEPMTPDDFE